MTPRIGRDRRHLHHAREGERAHRADRDTDDRRDDREGCRQQRAEHDDQHDRREDDADDLADAEDLGNALRDLGRERDLDAVDRLGLEVLDHGLLGARGQLEARLGELHVDDRGRSRPPRRRGSRRPARAARRRVRAAASCSSIVASPSVSCVCCSSTTARCASSCGLLGVDARRSAGRRLRAAVARHRAAPARRRAARRRHRAAPGPSRACVRAVVDLGADRPRTCWRWSASCCCVANGSITSATSGRSFADSASAVISALLLVGQGGPVGRVEHDGARCAAEVGQLILRARRSPRRRPCRGCRSSNSAP